MPDLVNVLAVVFPVFSIIAVGYLFASFRRISLEPIIDLLIYITIPALIISSLSTKKIDPTEMGLVAVAVIGVVLGTFLLSHAFLYLTGRRAVRGFYLTTMFMNSGNMAFPLALLAFGAEGLQIAVLYYVAISLLVYTVGIFIAKGHGGFGEILRLPLIYAAVFGLALNTTGFQLPGPIQTTVDMLAAPTIPLMQFSLGYYLYKTKFTEPALSIAGSVIRIGGGLAVAFLIVNLLGIEGVARNVILLSSAMPSAVINFVMSYKYDVDSEVVASVVATSTLLSVLTVPILLLLLM